MALSVGAVMLMICASWMECHNDACPHMCAHEPDESGNCSNACLSLAGMTGAVCRTATNPEIASAMLRNKLPNRVYHVER